MPILWGMKQTGSRPPIRTITDLVEVIPTLLGFHPSESVVVIAVEDGHVIVTARADLPGPGELLSQAMSALWLRYPRASFLLVGFSADAARGWASLLAVDEALPDGVERSLVVADGERWYAAPLDEGVAYDRVGSVHVARAAFEGRPVRRSRAELSALIEPARTPDELEASLSRVTPTLAGPSDLRQRAGALLAAHLADPGDLDLDDVTLLSLATHDDVFLDEHLWAMTKADAAVHQRLWLQVVRESVPACTGGALVALGLSSWLVGEGALQVVCLEALSRVEGPPAWIDLLDLINVGALSPNHWEAIVAGNEGVPATASGF